MLSLMISEAALKAQLEQEAKQRGVLYAFYVLYVFYILHHRLLGHGICDSLKVLGK
jgi:hypothetical protein